MKLDKKTLVSRIILIGVCLSIFGICFMRMNESYDPLARYPYVTDENREVILNHLNDDEISYIVDRQIEPEKFMDFIDVEGFNIRNTLLYFNAKKTQDAPNDFIVNFVNRYRSNITHNTIVDLCTYYSYNDLIAFYENESVLNDGLKLVPNPTAPLLVLDETHSVYKYEPSTLVEVKSIKVQEVMKKNLLSLLDEYKKTIGHELSLSNGYISFEENKEIYVSLEEKYGENIHYIANMSGQDESQLGYTIVLNGATEWLDMCNEADVFESHEYTKMIQDYEFSTETIDWLKENAYRFGFVIRFPEEKESLTNHVYQPFVLRYVGKKNAKKMEKNKTCLEEVNYTKIE